MCVDGRSRQDETCRMLWPFDAIILNLQITTQGPENFLIFSRHKNPLVFVGNQFVTRNGILMSSGRSHVVPVIILIV